MEFLKRKYECYKPFILMALCLMPLFITTLYALPLLVPVIAIASIYPFYHITNKVRERFFSYDNRASFLYVVLPFELFIILWGVLSINNHRVKIFVNSACIFLVLVIIAISPIFRWSRIKELRRIQYQYVYLAISFLVAVCECFVFWRAI